MNKKNSVWIKQSHFLIIIVMLIISCNRPPSNTIATAQKSVSMNVTSHDSTKSEQHVAPDTVLPEPIRSEVLGGWLRIGTADEQIINKLGEPQKGATKYWGALGAYVQEWKYPAKGISMEMESETETGPKTISRGGITIISPCELRTSQLISIGSPRANVMSRYSSLIDTINTEADKIIIGSIYGGTIFTFTDDRVSQIFIGAAAE
jgi:hypothetical protein